MLGAFILIWNGRPLSTPPNKSQQNYVEFDKWTLINAHRQSLLLSPNLVINPQLLAFLLLISYLEKFIDCRIRQQSLSKIQVPLEKKKDIKSFNTGYLRWNSLQSTEHSFRKKLTQFAPSIELTQWKSYVSFDNKACFPSGKPAS